MTPTLQSESTGDVKLTPELVAHLLRLTPNDRAVLADILEESLEEGPECSPEEARQAWKEEIERRWEEYKSGKVQAIPIEDFLARLRQRSEPRRAGS